jgi:hypothetical protein
VFMSKVEGIRVRIKKCIGKIKQDPDITVQVVFIRILAFWGILISWK